LRTENIHVVADIIIYVLILVKKRDYQSGFPTCFVSVASFFTQSKFVHRFRNMNDAWSDIKRFLFNSVGMFLAHVVCTLFAIKIQISLTYRRTSKEFFLICQAEYLLLPVLQISTNVLRKPITATRTQIASTQPVRSVALAKMDLQETVSLAPVGFDML